jgi:ATP-binding cassette subfamily B protein
MRVFGRPLPVAAAGTLALVGLLPRVSVAMTGLLAASVIVLAGLPVAIGVVTGLLVGSVPAAVEGGAGSAAAERTLWLLGAVALLVAVARALGPFQSALASAFSRAVDRHLQERLIAVVARPSGVAHLEDPETLDLVRNAQGVGAEGIQPGKAVQALATLLPSWLQALGSAAVLLGFSAALGALWLVLWPAVLFVLMREYIRVGQAGYGQAAAVRRSDYLRDLALTPPAAKELRVWGLTDWLVERFEAAWLTAMEPAWRARRPGKAVLWLAAGSVGALNIATFGLLAWAAAQGDLGLAALAVYSRAALDASAFRSSDDPNAHLAYAAVSVPALLELEKRLGEPPREELAALPPGAPAGSIRFEGVSFRYPGQPTPVLAGLDLEIPAGRSLAIVGANGAGKTTLIKLLCRLYEPTAGRVLVDDVDLRDVDPGSWQRRVAAIFQDFARYHLTARENVALGAAPDPARLRAAADRAGALDLIEALPRGWETILSRQYAGGTDLSGGQWQRIALARALYATNAGASVLILDEPTANLDVRAEAALYDRFLEITAGLTTILISHRFSTVRRADRIVVIDGGRVAEQGTHDELIALEGQYAAMFRLQAARFVDVDDAVEATP